MTMSKIALWVSLVLLSSSSVAYAQDNSAGEKKEGRGVMTLTEMIITGRIQKPIAAVEVARIQPRLALAELRQPFLERIERAIYKDPF